MILFRPQSLQRRPELVNGTHQNAIFDIFKIKVWDAQEKKYIGVLMGHTGSVKSVFSSNKLCQFNVVIISSSKPSAAVKGFHLSSQAKRIRRGKVASMSIRQFFIRKMSVVKFWDTGNRKSHVTQA
ncbi:hypothetical protein Ddye_025822 [Dipteronia dyeriana]|uniref:Uncharacterized protein n=1 Tax=Dipteronia dyeriana TaxID=168575 RepID=A0AAD9WPT7_9ROSI|nr:hypothetical protein Ddye_025822 [Dipteronia dyeriana]